MAEIGVSNKRSMFDSDSEDSNDGLTIGSAGTATAVKLSTTIAAANDENLSPTKKFKLTTNVSSSSVVGSDLVTNKIHQNQEEMSTDLKAVTRYPRRSTRCQKIDKTNFITESVKENENNTREKVKKNTKIISDETPIIHNESVHNETSISRTKGKSKRGRKKQTPINSNLTSVSIAPKGVLSNAFDIAELSNSDEEDTMSNFVPEESIKQPINTNSTNSNKTGSEKEAKISNMSTKATSASPADNTKCQMTQKTNTVSSNRTSSGTNEIININPGASSTKHFTPVNTLKTSLGQSFDGDCGPERANKVGPGEEAPVVLTAAQRAKIEQNRQKALLIRQERMNKMMPTLKKSEQLEKEGKKVLRINDTKLVDTGGGFFLEEEDGFDAIPEADIIAALRRAEEPAPLIPEDRPRCSDCGNVFDSSYLVKHFDHPVCDDCRDNESAHALITKTDARNEYLLQDVDLEKRDPPLRFIVRKNPHNDRWGDMKLYLKLQVEKRCMEVWGSEEALEEAIAKKAQQREVSKQKKFKKKMLELRMNVRSSLYTRASKSHEHEYGDEEYIEEDDEYSKTCATCDHSYRYDKM